MTEADWKDIAIIGRTSEKEIDDRVEVEWKLSAKPELEWAKIFQMADLAEREGTLEWVFGEVPTSCSISFGGLFLQMRSRMQTPKYGTA